MFPIASLDVDAQKGFTDVCPNELPIPKGHEIVRELNQMSKYIHFRLDSKDWHPPDPKFFGGKK